MDRIKAEFKENPLMVIGVAIAAATAFGMVLNATAKIVESSAYAYRASKLK